MSEDVYFATSWLGKYPPLIASNLNNNYLFYCLSSFESHTLPGTIREYRFPLRLDKLLMDPAVRISEDVAMDDRSN